MEYTWVVSEAWLFQNPFVSPKRFSRLPGFSMIHFLSTQNLWDISATPRYGEDFYYILYHNEYQDYGKPWPIDDPAAFTGPAEKEYEAEPGMRWVVPSGVLKRG